MKIPIGSIVEIRFLDHVASIGGINSPAVCVAIGVLIAQDKEAYYVASWLTEDHNEENADTHTIIKSTVKKIRLIKRGFKISSAKSLL